MRTGVIHKNLKVKRYSSNFAKKMTAPVESKEGLKCSYCDRKEEEVATLIKIKNDYICEHCVAALNGICSDIVPDYDTIAQQYILVDDDWDKVESIDKKIEEIEEEKVCEAIAS